MNNDYISLLKNNLKDKELIINTLQKEVKTLQDYVKNLLDIIKNFSKENPSLQTILNSFVNNNRLLKSQIEHLSDNNAIHNNNNIIQGMNNTLAFNNIQLNSQPQKIIFEDYYYHGELKNGLPHGLGTAYLDGGTIYHGEFDRGKLTGWGVIFYKSGSKGAGQFINRSRNGIFCGIIANDLTKYLGEFIEGKREGSYIQIFGNGNECFGDKYFSEYKNDKQNGKVLYFYKNRDIEFGTFKDGKQIGGTIISHPKGHYEKKINK